MLVGARVCSAGARAPINDAARRRMSPRIGVGERGGGGVDAERSVEAAGAARPGAGPGGGARGGGGGSSRGGSSSRGPDPSQQRSECRTRCDRAAWDCSSRCQYCGGCPTGTMTWDQCNNTCNSCRQGCDQNERFCKAACGD